MSVMTHDTRWRLLVGAAPLIGVAFFVWAAAQGEPDVARSPTARAILALVAALGTVVAWWTARQLRTAPAVPVSKAAALARSGQLCGPVALRGRARALPDAVPLISPDGELCLWFRQGEPPVHPPGGADGARPFLLVDDSGECIVLPAGADVTGAGSVPAAAARSRLAGGGDTEDTPGPDAAQRLLRNGDRIHVTGRFVAASPEALALQAEAAAPTPRHGLALPVIAMPGPSQPFVIRIGADEGEGGLYGLLAAIDCLVLVVASSLVAWSMFAPA
jgi:hypothetical protein